MAEFFQERQPEEEKRNLAFGQLDLNKVLDGFIEFESVTVESKERTQREFKRFQTEHQNTLSTIGLVAKLDQRSYLRIYLEDQKRLFDYFDFLDQKKELENKDINNLNILASFFFLELDECIDWEKIEDNDLGLLASLNRISSYYQRFLSKIEMPDPKPFYTMLLMAEMGKMIEKRYLKQYFLARKFGLFKEEDENGAFFLFIMLKMRLFIRPDGIFYLMPWSHC